MPNNNQLRGVIFVAISYILWGVLPIYWKLLQHVSAQQVLCHRIVWCVVFMLLLIIISNRWKSFRLELREIFVQPQKLIGIILSALILNMNWFIYIWAVIHNHVIEASLGYYINPLVSVILGVVVLRERMNIWQYLAFFLAFLAVLNLTVHFGSIPWISISLAVTFGLYGLLKKMVGAGAITGLTLETLIMLIPALIYLIYVHQTGYGSFNTGSLTTSILLIGAGIVTAVPLLLFSSGTLSLSLTIVGFLQYISPTLTLLLGIFLYHESFTAAHLMSFALIWIGLIIFTVSQTRALTQAVKSIV
ncbi:MAG: EamA family transporter RarD [Syntrophomonas sp.]